MKIDEHEVYLYLTINHLTHWDFSQILQLEENNLLNKLEMSISKTFMSTMKSAVVSYVDRWFQ